METSNGGQLGTKGIGTVIIPVGNSTFTLNNVFYCPDGAANMLSPGVLKIHDIVVDGMNNSLVHKESGITIAHIKWKFDVAILDCETPPGFYNFALLPYRATTKNVECALMHRRLGNAGKDRVLVACWKSGINIDPETIKDFHCKACHLAKFKATVSRTPLVKPTTFLQHVFWDTIEHSPIGYGGYRYSLHGIEALTRYQWLILATTRKEAIKKLKGWKRTVEIASGGFKVMFMAFDNAREFVSKEIQDWALEEGFVLRTSAPYWSQQNGLPKRAGKALMDSARATCLETGLPYTVWPFFMEVSVYVNNMLPSSTNKDFKSPIEMMFEQIRVDYDFSVKHIQTWGCIAYVKKPEQEKVRSENMSAKASQDFLVGSGGLNGHIYKVYLPDQNKVVRARDVRFRETTAPQAEDEPKVELEAVLIDPDLEDGGRIIMSGEPLHQKHSEDEINQNDKAEEAVDEHSVAEKEMTEKTR